MEKEYTKVTLGNRSGGTFERIWLAGDTKQVIAELGEKGFDVITKRPSRKAEKPEAAKAPKAKAVKKEKAAKKSKKQEAARELAAVA